MAGDDQEPSPVDLEAVRRSGGCGQIKEGTPRVLVAAGRSRHTPEVVGVGESGPHSPGDRAPPGVGPGAVVATLLLSSRPRRHVVSLTSADQRLPGCRLCRPDAAAQRPRARPRGHLPGVQAGFSRRACRQDTRWEARRRATDRGVRGRGHVDKEACGARCRGPPPAGHQGRRRRWGAATWPTDPRT